MYGPTHSKRTGLLFVFILLLSVLLVGGTLLLIGVRTAHADPDVIYVDANAPGPTHDGLSWTTAFTTPQDALAEVVYGDEIWVATGVYTPGVARADTFQLSAGVAIYGGFPTGGGDGSFEARDWQTNVTVLSGDIDGDDVTDSQGVVTNTANITGANVYHVVTGRIVTETAVLDGFTVTAGSADGVGWPRYAGGGMLSNLAGPTLANLTFRGNHATLGGGMCSYSYAVNNPVLTNVAFVGNTASRGGGMFNSYSDPMLTNVSFRGNETDDDGGGMCNEQSSPILTDVIFSGNHAARTGGGLYNALSSAPVLTNVTFSGNHSGNSGGGLSNSGTSPTLVNCILWGNSPDSVSNTAGGGAAITYSDVEWSNGVYTGTGNINEDPLFVAPVLASEVSTTAGDYRLQAGSPAVDVGLNAAVPSGVTSDLDGASRIVDGDGDGDAIVDMGAYEFQQFKVFLPLATRDFTDYAFELGGHVYDESLPYEDRMHYAGMTWAKAIVEYPEDAQSIIAAAHDEEFKVQVTAVGAKDMVTESGFEQDFATWVGDLAAAGADAIEVWSSPNIGFSWPSGWISPTLYTDLLCASHDAIKAADRSALVISAGPAGTDFFGGCSPQGCDDLPWLEALHAAGAAGCVDYLGAYHNGGATAPSARSGHPADPTGSDHWLYFLWQTQEYYDAFGGNVPLFYTELGYASQEGVAPFPDTFSWATGTTNAEQAAWLAEAAELSVSTGMVDYIMVYNIDYPRMGDDPADGYAIIRPDDSCPACESLHDLLGSR